MGRIPQPLRDIIAHNIRAERMKNYPGRGGAKECAAAFSRFVGKVISPQQWCPWERGIRTPDEFHLQQIAEFFGRTVEHMRRDHSRSFTDGSAQAAAIPGQPHQDMPTYAALSIPEVLMSMARDRMKAVYRVEISVSPARYVPCEDAP